MLANRRGIAKGNASTPLYLNRIQIMTRIIKL